MTKPWWEYSTLIDMMQSDSGNRHMNLAGICTCLCRQGLDTGRETRICERNGQVASIAAMRSKMAKLGGKTPWSEVAMGENGELKEANRSFYCWPDAFAVISHYGEPNSNTLTSCSVDWATNNRKLMLEFAAMTASMQDEPVQERAPVGTVYAFISGIGGMQLQSIGVTHAPLQRDNYTKEVLYGFDHIVADLKSVSPSGRIAILDGPPGTGKTWSVRGLFSAVPEAMFVLVPPKFISSIGDPNFIPTILREQDGGGPIVIVLEDADEVLSPRKARNMDSVMAALNLGDGILGELLRIRIVATTNSPIRAIEKALLRPGRLSHRMTIGKLPAEQVAQVYRRLTGSELNRPKSMTIAEVYALARPAMVPVPDAILPERRVRRPKLHLRANP